MLSECILGSQVSTDWRNSDPQDYSNSSNKNSQISTARFCFPGFDISLMVGKVRKDAVLLRYYQTNLDPPHSIDESGSLSHELVRSLVESIHKFTIGSDYEKVSDGISFP